MLLGHHRKIYDAIRARDPEAAGQAMQSHLDAIVRSYAAVDAPANEPDAPKAVGTGA
jgi:DNA-binding FadR family transcriptional regulator